MARPVTGKIMEDKIWVRKKNGTYYCYQRRRVWKDGKAVLLGKTLLGKADKIGGELRQTRPKRPAGSRGENEDAPPKASRKHTGMMEIIDFIGRESGVDEDLYASVDAPIAQKLLSLARYVVGTGGDTYPGIEEWMFTHPLPYTHPITEDVYRPLLDIAGIDESMRQNYFRNRFAREGGLALSVAYDATTQNSVTVNPESRDGENKCKNGKPSVKVLVLYSLESRQPLAYFKQPGNIPDIISINTALSQAKALGAKGDILIVTDNGFASEENLAATMRSGHHFLTRLKNGWKWVRDEIDKHGDELRNASNCIMSFPTVKGITVALTREFRYKRAYGSKAKGLEAGDTDKFKRRIYMHIYYDAARKEKEDREFMENLAEIKKAIEDGQELTEEAGKTVDAYLSVKERKGKKTVAFLNGKIDEACRCNGVFVLASDKRKDKEEALRIYRKREWIEDYFERFKQYADGSTSRTGSPENLQGRMFVQFLAMGYIEFIQEKIRKLKETLGVANGDPSHDTEESLKKERGLRHWLEKRSAHRVLTWFDAYETVEVSIDVTKRRWSTATIERDRLFLKLLGMPDGR